MLKRRCFIYAIIFIVVVLAIILIFYSAPFVKGNNSVVYANKNVIDINNKSVWTSSSNFKKLQIVDESLIQDNHFISIKTKSSINILSWNQILITYKINATVSDWDSLEKIKEYQETKTIVFKFLRLKWIIDNVL